MRLPMRIMKGTYSKMTICLYTLQIPVKYRVFAGCTWK